MVDRRGRPAQSLIAALGFLPPAAEPSFNSCTGSSTLGAASASSSWDAAPGLRLSLSHVADGEVAVRGRPDAVLAQGEAARTDASWAQAVVFLAEVRPVGRDEIDAGEALFAEWTRVLATARVKGFFPKAVERAKATLGEAGMRPLNGS